MPVSMSITRNTAVAKSSLWFYVNEAGAEKLFLKRFLQVFSCSYLSVLYKLEKAKVQRLSDIKLAEFFDTRFVDTDHRQLPESPYSVLSKSG